MVRSLQWRRDVNWGSESAAARTYEDGLGIRRVEKDASDGSAVEVLEVSHALAGQDGFASAVRASVARFASLKIEGLSTIRRVDGHGHSLRVVADHLEGLRLPDLLREAVKGNIPLPQPAALELAGQMIRIISAIHKVAGLSHGTITPGHIVITRTGKVVITDAVFGSAIESLQRSREQLWREFRLALPASASLPRFDQRADVAQLGATVLAVALGRSLRADEYPRAVNEVVIAATLAAKPGETGTSTSALRMWLQESMCLHPRAAFASMIDAEKAFDEVLGVAVVRRNGAAALQSSVRRIFGDTPAAEEAAKVAAAWSSPAVIHPAPDAIRPEPAAPEIPAPVREETHRPLSSIFRAVLPRFRAQA